MHMTDKLNKNVTIGRQFLRSINLAADLGRSDALNGYICQESAKSLMSTMAHHLNETEQRAFTWTGPYGGGKSSLALALGSLISANKTLREEAKKIFGIKTGDKIDRAWSTSKDGWLVLPVVGKRDSVISAISGALDKIEGVSTKRPKSNDTISRLIIQAENRKKDGVLLILDELGKFLEAAAQTGEDIYFYQELAEAASRSKGKLVVVGVLHQAFEQYATKLGRDARDEWAKIQGRYIDIPLVVGSDEVIELVGKSIEKKSPTVAFKKVEKYAELVAEVITKRRPNAPANIKKSLLNCWPLHPVTAALLAPISRKRFSQNERSVFGFLASAEPLGFTDFLNSMPDIETSMYTPARYWDYLKANMEQAILASQDGHRWAVANDAIERTEAREGCTETHVQLAKTIALLDLFRTGSGLAAENALLEVSVNAQPKDIRTACEDLARWSVIVLRKHINAWSIYSGSDFDIDSAVNQARAELGDVDIKQLIELSELNPIVAKSHYHETGTLRWFSRSLIQTSTAKEYLNTFSAPSGSAGEFILIAPSIEFGVRKNKSLVQELSEIKTNSPTVLGFAANSERVFELGMELSSLEKVQKSRRELEGDAVARKEVNGRIATVKSELADELKNSFDTAEWFQDGQPINRETRLTLPSIASKLALETFPQTPPIHNELVNRESLSANAVKARRELMYQMINFKGEKRLGYEGFSADAGLYYSIIEHNNLYQLIDGEWTFITNDKKLFGKHFSPMWEAADKIFKKSKEAVTLQQLYDTWQTKPIGARKGILPIFALIYFLANRHNLGLYIESTFIPDLTEAYLDEWMQDTKRVAFKYVEIGKQREALLKALSISLTESLGQSVTASPLESARGLVSLIATLPNWTKRTTTVSLEAQKLRSAILKANDPHKVLFSDLPNLLEAEDEIILVNKISNLTKELQSAYPALLEKFKDILFKALDHKGSIKELNERAESIKGISGDFGVDAFVARLSVFKDDIESLEGILSTAITKNPKDWVDRDQEAAINSLGKICSSFRNIESLSNLRGKSATRKAFAFVYTDPKSSVISKNFDIAEDKLPELKKISSTLLNDLKKKGLSDDEILATLAHACSQTVN
jgi:hypothetical protein